MRLIYLSLGSNLGNRLELLSETRDFIEFNIGDIVNSSDVYETEPWEMENVEPFLNQVLSVRTAMSNTQIINEISEIDAFYGRKRSTEKYLSREMDVDVLFIEQEIIDTPKLKVPHPKISERRFILEPLCQIAPDFVDPLTQKTITSLLESCQDKCKVKKL
ncbi:MAG: 2-amino-4-hydroxy-6-hydroxymethyldihydropteridine diphosphokinase [Flavobacteriales bacterium]